jgi:hypothetical protein
MRAREKLNAAFVTGSLCIAGLLGLVTGSGTVFLGSLAVLVVLDLVVGNIRLSRRP